VGGRAVLRRVEKFSQEAEMEEKKVLGGVRVRSSTQLGGPAPRKRDGHRLPGISKFWSRLISRNRTF